MVYHEHMNIEATIRSYLPQVIHLSLATCRDNRPWVCEVHFASDDDLNLYFCSSPQRRHSQEIAANPHVAGNIVTQHHLGQKVRGVYFEGVAKELENVNEGDIGYKVYSERFETGPALLSDLKAPGGGRLYQITVSDYYLFDNYNGPSAKHQLPWGKGDSK